ncbi:MAG TPA: hypothetical protein VJ696_01485, partial [Rhodanobacteraceae bacterium]|nr:hypothetical protein [Rhodanobacteraceae bacterium]
MRCPAAGDASGIAAAAERAPDEKMAPLDRDRIVGFVHRVRLAETSETIPTRASGERGEDSDSHDASVRSGRWPVFVIESKFRSMRARAAQRGRGLRARNVFAYAQKFRDLAPHACR